MYEDIVERLALIAELAYPLTCTPDNNSVLASYISELAQFSKTPADIREELKSDPDWSEEDEDDDE